MAYFSYFVIFFFDFFYNIWYPLKVYYIYYYYIVSLSNGTYSNIDGTSTAYARCVRSF